MMYVVSDELRKRAKNPHELFMINLFGFHLLLTPALLFAGLGEAGLLIPPILSGFVIAYVAWRGRRVEPWFVRVHWKLTLGRAKLLLMAYGATAVLLLGAWLISLGAGKTQAIMFTVLTRVAVMPTVIMVFVAAVLESSGIYQASRGEVPDRLVERFPAPADLERVEE